MIVKGVRNEIGCKGVWFGLWSCVGVRDERGREQQNIEYRIMNNEVKGKKRERTAEYRISNKECRMSK